MKFGLTDQEYHFIETNVVAPMSKLGAVVWCFGSRARGNFKRFSDLDLMIEIDRDLSQEINAIRELLTNSNFPIKVDIVQLSEFAESYRKGYQQEKKLF
jgi:predicted nucleotidyltransferase